MKRKGIPLPLFLCRQEVIDECWEMEANAPFRIRSVFDDLNEHLNKIAQTPHVTVVEEAGTNDEWPAEHLLEFSILCTKKDGNGITQTLEYRQYHTTVFGTALVRFSSDDGSRDKIRKVSETEDMKLSDLDTTVSYLQAPGVNGEVVRVIRPAGLIGKEKEGQIRITVNKNPFQSGGQIIEYEGNDCKITVGPAHGNE